MVVTPNHPLKNRVLHYKPSILGYPYFRNPPYVICIGKDLLVSRIFWLWLPNLQSHWLDQEDFPQPMFGFIKKADGKLTGFSIAILGDDCNSCEIQYSESLDANQWFHDMYG